MKEKKNDNCTYFALFLLSFILSLFMPFLMHFFNHSFLPSFLHSFIHLFIWQSSAQDEKKTENSCMEFALFLLTFILSLFHIISPFTSLIHSFIYFGNLVQESERKKKLRIVTHTFLLFLSFMPSHFISFLHLLFHSFILSFGNLLQQDKKK